jgi:hypothetical protein
MEDDRVCSPGKAASPVLPAMNTSAGGRAGPIKIKHSWIIFSIFHSKASNMISG